MIEIDLASHEMLLTTSPRPTKIVDPRHSRRNFGVAGVFEIAMETKIRRDGALPASLAWSLI
jgi:hypothetical protein